MCSADCDYVDIRDRARSLDGLVAFRYVTVGVATDPIAAPRLRMGVMASSNLFAVMGVEPTIGRSFRPEEDHVPGRDAVVVLGRTMWEQEFGSDQGVLGRSMRINGEPFTIIGVAPPGFTGLDQFVRSDFFVPVMMSSRLINDPKAASLEARDARTLTLKGRLKAGASQASAQSELTAMAADLERAYPDTNKNRRFTIRTELQARVAQDPPDSMLIAMLSTLALAVLLPFGAIVGFRNRWQQCCCWPGCRRSLFHMRQTTTFYVHLLASRRTLRPAGRLRPGLIGSPITASSATRSARSEMPSPTAVPRLSA